MIARARQSVWWPEVNVDLRRAVQDCRTCVERSPSTTSKTPLAREPALYPFQRVHADLGAYGGRQWLVIVDQFSGWPVVKNLGKTADTKSVTAQFRTLFELFGISETIYTDGGPQFRHEFADFCKMWNVNHVTSSPYNPRPTGAPRWLSRP